MVMAMGGYENCSSSTVMVLVVATISNYSNGRWYENNNVIMLSELL